MGRYLGVFTSDKAGPKWRAWRAMSEAEQQATAERGVAAVKAWEAAHVDVIDYVGGPLGPTKRISDAGAVSVVGSLWAVPTISTGLLMYMFHHFMREAPDDPGAALRRAQLWMLDPRRQVPDGAVALARQVSPDRLVEPYRWAGFVHLGR